MIGGAGVLAATDRSNRVLLVAGMHRSGTSLTANWLEKCGVHMGDELIPADYSNPAGHYEDRVISHFQRQILRDNGWASVFITDSCPIRVSDARRQEALALIEARQHYQSWGWKDPRTSLLLGFWKSLLPDMKVVAVYRSYAQVTDSLLRRESKRGKRTRYRLLRTAQRLWRAGKFSFLNVPLVRSYLGTWYRYNTDILQFASAHPDDLLMLHVDDLLQHADSLISFVNNRWGFTLKPVPITDVYDPVLLTTATMPIQSLFASRLMPACQTLHNQLENWRYDTLQRLSAL